MSVVVPRDEARDYLIASRLTDVILGEGFLAAHEDLGFDFEDPALIAALGPIRT